MIKTFEEALDIAIKNSYKRMTDYWKSGGGRNSLGRDMDKYNFSMAEAFRFGRWFTKSRMLGCKISRDNLARAFRKYTLINLAS